MESVESNPCSETPTVCTLTYTRLHDSDDDNLSTGSEWDYKVSHDICDHTPSVQRVMNNLKASEMIVMTYTTTASTTTSISRARKGE